MFVLDKRFSNRWQGRVSYVWSKNEGTMNNSGFEHLRFEHPVRVGRPARSSTSSGRSIRPVPRAKSLSDLPDPEGGHRPQQLLAIPLGLALHALSAVRHQRGRFPGRRRPGSSSSRAAAAGGERNNLDLRLEKIFKRRDGDQPDLRLRRRPERLQRGHHHRRPTRYPAWRSRATTSRCSSGDRPRSPRRAVGCSARAGASSEPVRRKPAAARRELRPGGRRPRGPSRPPGLLSSGEGLRPPILAS